MYSLKLRAALALAALAAANAPAQSPASPYFREHQIFVGGGGGNAFEADIFNVRGDGANEARVNPAQRLGYVLNLDERWGVGVLMHGYSDEFENVVTNGEGSMTVEFGLDTYNFGGTVQHYFSRGRVQPYVYATAGLAFGTVTAKAEGESSADLDYDGFSFGAGGGALLVVARYVGLSFDGILSMGSAEWDELPFTNSADKSFSPSYWAATLNLVVFIP